MVPLLGATTLLTDSVAHVPVLPALRYNAKRRHWRRTKIGI